MKKALMIMLMITMFIAGGMVFAECSADTPEEIAPEEVVTVEPAEPEEEPEEEQEAVEEEAEEPEEPEQEAEAPEANTPEEIIAEDTGLQVDEARRVDGYKDWSFYEVFADGDIYAITIKGEHVDVVTQIN